MPSGPFISYAQNAEDVVLHRALGHIVNGRYLDVGAFDPERDSVTLQLYARGWRGLNLDPVPAYTAAMASGRPEDVNLQVAAGDQPGSLLFHIVRDTGLSTLRTDIAEQHRTQGYQVDELSVQVLTLDALIDEHFPDQELHVLKVDVEGAEAQVLAGIDLVRHRPWVLLVEATLPNSATPSHGDWEPALLARGYLFTMFDGLSRWYVAREHAAALGPALGYPACVLDDYVQVENVRTGQRAQDAEQALEQCRAELEVLAAAARDADHQRTVLQAELEEARWQSGLLEQERTWLQGLLAEKEQALEQAREQALLPVALARARRRATGALQRIADARHR